METEQITSASSLAAGLAACREFNMTVTLGYAYLTEYWNVTVLPQAYLDELEAAVLRSRRTSSAVPAKR